MSAFNILDPKYVQDPELLVQSCKKLELKLNRPAGEIIKLTANGYREFEARGLVPAGTRLAFEKAAGIAAS